MLLTVVYIQVPPVVIVRGLEAEFGFESGLNVCNAGQTKPNPD